MLKVMSRSKLKSFSQDDNSEQRGRDLNNGEKSEKGKKIKVLICSGNMGNEKPNESSLNSWIPGDGNCREVLENPNYPVMRDEEDLVYENNNEYGNTNDSFINGKKKKDASIYGNVVDNQFTSNGSIKYFEEEEPDDMSVERFDIIVIGMQESTFDLEKDDESKEGDEENQLEVEISSKYLSPEDANHPLAQAEKIERKKKKNKVFKARTKVSSAVTTLAANRDYMAKETVETEDTSFLHEMLTRRLKSYKRIVSYQRGEMRLMIFVLEQSILPVEVNFVRTKTTGVGGLANKGGIAAELAVNKTTTMAFCSCHLEAHEGISKYEARCSSMSDIFGGTRKYHNPPTCPDFSLTNHYSFVMGDLNFRTRFTEENSGVNSPELMAKARNMVTLKTWEDLNSVDELQRAIRNKEAFAGFDTLYCNFPPTFKVQRQPGYEYKDNRTPSYTDRILWKTGHLLEDNVIPLSYEPIDDFSTSDHKPIRGSFEVRLNDALYFQETKKSEAPRTRRRASITALLNLTSSDPYWNNEREELHLFVSEIQCELRSDCTSSGVVPYPYLCLTTSPEEIIDKKQENTWLKKLLFLGSNLSTNTEAGGGLSRTFHGWPRSEKVKEATYEPDWTSKNDIHCVLQTKDSTGKPLNLSGAILHMAVFSGNKKMEEEWIGTFPFNLHDLLESCKKNTNSGTKVKRSMPKRVHNQSFRSSKSLNRGLVGAIGKSTSALFRNLGYEDVDNSDDNDLGIFFSNNVEGSLNRNGKETGKITCTIEAWTKDRETSSGNLGTRKASLVNCS